MKELPLGPLMIDIAGTELTDLDRERLCHPLVGGIILFSRNYVDPVQLTALTAAIHELRSPALLIAVDHEGGRVQRFRDGFTRLPPMAALGRLWDSLRHLVRMNVLKSVPLSGQVAAVSCGLHQGTPVLDLDYAEDSKAEVDLNLVATKSGAIVEVQGTAEGAPFQPEELNAMLALAQQGMRELFELQRAALAD